MIKRFGNRRGVGNTTPVSTSRVLWDRKRWVRKKMLAIPALGLLRVINADVATWQLNLAQESPEEWLHKATGRDKITWRG